MNPMLYSRRQVALWGGLILLVLLPVFIWAGFWQWDKAEAKLARQTELDARSHFPLREMPAALGDAEALRHFRFVLHGRYEAEGQVLVDNRVHAQRAGYHVVTPLRLAGSETRVLVNRGWVAASGGRRAPPAVPPPSGPVEVTGIAVAPPERFFTLADPPPGLREAVWQNLDLQRFAKLSGHPVQPVVVLLDAEAPGGYVREWPRPDEHAEHNLGYAVQWFGFAVAALGIWLHLLLRRRPPE